MEQLAQFIVFCPLLGALIAGFVTPLVGYQSQNAFAQTMTVGGLVISAVLSWILFISMGLGLISAYVLPLFEWVSVGDFSFNWALRVDMLTAVMFIVVTSVSSLVHIYSIGYMSHDDAQPRFMAYLSLFTFMMLMLVSADNLVQMFFGWEGVGLASYLLIGFWYKKPSANAAAIKAFLVNRVGDIGFALGIFALYILTGSVQFSEIFAAVPDLIGSSVYFLGGEFDAITLVALLLFLGAMGKSAQLGLHTWLPDAMEGPTPVSALIHAATMVTAGVFMVCRLSPLIEYSDTALMVITWVGAATAFFAATIGLTQTDIKRVIAYSTCSQLGYMFFAAGVSAYPAAMFHLTTHAFFKALLFLGAGSVIHAMSDEQNMLRMGGIGGYIRQTRALMWIGSLALAGIGIPGVIGFAGFYSKDIMLEAAYAAGTGTGFVAFWAGILAAFMTAFYSWRLLILTFDGEPRGDERVIAHVHESPPVMLWPLYLLAIGAVTSGFLLYGWFVGNSWQTFWGDALFILPEHQGFEQAHHVPLWVKWLPLIMGLGGIALAYVIYRDGLARAQSVARFFGPFYRLSFNKWYIDEIYDFLFVRPAQALGRFFWIKGDGFVIDGFGPDGVAGRTRALSARFSAAQSGYLYHYAFVMLIGVVVLVAWVLLS